MAASGYAPWSVVVGEQPTTTKWNILGTNDASFYSGNGINDQAIVFRHLQADMVPTGAMYIWTTPTAPSANWLLCQGQAVSRTTYAPLFSVIGTTYGTGDGSTTFNVPNMQGRVPAGLSTGDSNFTGLNQQGGEDAHTLSYNEMPVHSHGVNDPGHSHGVGAAYLQDVGSGGNIRNPGGGSVFRGLSVPPIYASGTGISLSNAGSGYSHNNLQPYITLNFIIKT